jgi:predicted AAA+ superfamily ATPase
MKIARDGYLNQLIQRRHSPYVKIITGVRRCGKSYLLNRLYAEYLHSEGVSDEQMIVIELDDDRFEPLRGKKALREYVEEQASDENIQYYIILDEIQMVDEFEGTVVSLNNHANYDVYITGSNSRFLSKDISTRFKDRGVENRIHPLSYSEFYGAYEGDKRFALQEYLTYGGMPHLFDEPDEASKIRYLDNLITQTYLSDVVEHNDVRLPEEMGSLFDVLCSITGSLVNPSGIAGTLRAEKHVKATDKTVYTYIQYLEDAFLLERARRYDIKGKAYLKTPAKYYPEDVGLRNVRLNFRQNDIGFGIENVIYNELRARGYAVDVGMLECRESGNDGKLLYKQLEVDFIARLGSREYYIQIMDRIPSGKHGNNEYDSLRKVPGSFRKIVVVNMPFKAYVNDDGILVGSLEEFVLNKDSLNL